MASAKKHSPTITHTRFSHSKKSSSGGGWTHTTHRPTCDVTKVISGVGAHIRKYTFTHSSIKYLRDLQDEGECGEMGAAAHCVVSVCVCDRTALDWPLHRLPLPGFVLPVHTGHQTRLKHSLPENKQRFVDISFWCAKVVDSQVFLSRRAPSCGRWWNWRALWGWCCSSRAGWQWSRQSTSLSCFLF